MPEKTEKEAFRIIPKPKVKTPAWIKLFLYVCLIVVGVLIGGFFLLQGQVVALEQEKDDLGAQIIEVERQTQEILAKEIVDLSKKISTFSRLFRERKNLSKVFGFLRSICHPKVQFSSCKIEGKNNFIGLIAVTESFQTLGEQLFILKENEEIETLDLFGVSFDARGKIQFEVNITLSEKFFKK